jgi:hypothetical protein
VQQGLWAGVIPARPDEPGESVEHVADLFAQAAQGADRQRSVPAQWRSGELAFFMA